MTDQEQTTHEETASSDQSIQEQQRAGEARSASTGAEATASPTATDPGARADGGSQSETAGTQRAAAARTEPSETEGGDERAPLFAGDEAERFRQRWERLQASFVDQPREVVAQADDLVGELMQQLTAGFSDKRASLEAQWEEGEQASTEDLRIALTRYRSFFNRLLSV